MNYGYFMLFYLIFDLNSLMVPLMVAKGRFYLRSAISKPFQSKIISQIRFYTNANPNH